MALTMVFSPGITATDLSARNTLNVLRALKLPRSTAIVTYDIPRSGSGQNITHNTENYYNQPNILTRRPHTYHRKV